MSLRLDQAAGIGCNEEGGFGKPRSAFGLHARVVHRVCTAGLSGVICLERREYGWTGEDGEAVKAPGRGLQRSQGVNISSRREKRMVQSTPRALTVQRMGWRNWTPSVRRGGYFAYIHMVPRGRVRRGRIREASARCMQNAARNKIHLSPGAGP